MFSILLSTMRCLFLGKSWIIRVHFHSIVYFRCFRWDLNHWGFIVPYEYQNCMIVHRFSSLIIYMLWLVTCASFMWLLHNDFYKENILKWKIYDPMNFMLLIFLVIVTSNTSIIPSKCTVRATSSFISSSAVVIRWSFHLVNYILCKITAFMDHFLQLWYSK